MTNVKRLEYDGADYCADCCEKQGPLKSGCESCPFYSEKKEERMSNVTRYDIRPHDAHDGHFIDIVGDGDYVLHDVYLALQSKLEERERQNGRLKKEREELQAELRKEQAGHAETEQALDNMREERNQQGELLDIARGDLAILQQASSLYVVFDGPPSHEAGRFIEVQNEAGESVGSDQRAPQWNERENGLWYLGPFGKPQQASDAEEKANTALKRINRMIAALMATVESDPDRDPAEANILMAVNLMAIHRVVNDWEEICAKENTEEEK